MEGKITEEQASEIANFVLDNIDKTENSGQVMDFLENLIVKWPIFDHILTAELSQITDRKEDVAIEKAEDLIKENKIDEALNVVKTATEEQPPVAAVPTGGTS